MNKTFIFVALLRGINVGGNKILKKESLIKLFELCGFTNIKTLLASGNIIFESHEKNCKDLKKIIEEKFKTALALQIEVIVKNMDEIKDLVSKNPFKNIKITPQTKLYVTFLPENKNINLKIPYQSPGDNFRILHVYNNQVFSIINPSNGVNSTDFMKFLEKEYGKKITTRNWNTIKKISEL